MSRTTPRGWATDWATGGDEAVIGVVMVGRTFCISGEAEKRDPFAVCSVAQYTAPYRQLATAQLRAVRESKQTKRDSVRVCGTSMRFRKDVLTEGIGMV